jgi:glutamate-1-semialdehyde 2,1-aminomutase
VLIFDEVMTGFRVASGGAQQVYGVTPDMTCLGKVIGGGLPVGAFGGRIDIMNMIAPLGGVYQAGTLSGSPLAVAAGLCMLEAISQPDFYSDLGARAETLMSGLKSHAAAAGIPFTTNQVGGMFGCFFSEEDTVTTFEQVMACNSDHFQRYFHLMLEGGVYLAPSAFEAGFISIAHGDAELDATLAAAEHAFSVLAN